VAEAQVLARRHGFAVERHARIAVTPVLNLIMIAGFTTGEMSLA
jgi:hypothetical protein